jgi:hypothetical protein
MNRAASVSCFDKLSMRLDFYENARFLILSLLKDEECEPY